MFRSTEDAELANKIYGACPVLVNDLTGQTPWDVRFFRMFDMAMDSHLFRSPHWLESNGFQIGGFGFYTTDDTRYLRLFEGKMIHQFDHRFAQVATREDPSKSRGLSVDVSVGQHQDPNFYPRARHYVREEEVTKRALDRAWFIGFRDVTGAVANIRTAVFAVLPLVAIGHKIPIVLPGPRFGATHAAALTGNLNSFAFDYTVRQKISGMSLSFFILKQLPVLPPDRYLPELLELIVARVLELTYTAWDIKAFADNLWREADESLRRAIVQQWEANVAETGGHVGAEPPSWVEVAPDGFPHPPFKWDEERRARLRAELDALYAHLYGLTREELDYILDTFPIVRRKDEEKYGEYRTKRMVLKEYDRLEKGIVPWKTT